MIVKTEAIVLRSMKYGETSRILTLYTRDFGRMSVIVKGARSAKPKFGAALDLMSHSAVVMYKKEHRELQLLTQADLLHQYRRVIDNADRLMYGFAILEFLSATVHGEEAHEELFEILHSSLEALNEEQARPENILLHYLLRLSQALGIGLDAGSCVRCGLALEEEDALRRTAHFSLSRGGFTCAHCPPPPDVMDCAVESVRDLQWIDRHEVGNIVTLAMSRRAAGESLNLLHRHLASHIPEMKAIKSLPMIDLFAVSDRDGKQ
ncbi:MAG: DNA repair protein RecO [Ignavibacteria bacterium]|nr:MAG: DNA repair protein RecO [Ignavibacteria bacterium]